MTEREHTEAIMAAWPESGSAPPELLLAVESALRDYPNSPRLWCMRGDIIQLSESVEDDLELADALNSYEKAIELNPSWADAHESVGHFLDSVMDDSDRAKPYFERAAELRGAAY